MLRVDDPDFKLYLGDARDVLGYLPDRTIDCIVTSPPYWKLRDYGEAAQIGLERTPQQYVATLVQIFNLARRVLRDDGTLWLNLGDTYMDENAHGLKVKDLVGIPWMTALALRADGWWLRSEVIWSKRNVMPSSVSDRPTTAHEHLFMLAKSHSYFFDQDAVRVEYAYDGRTKMTVKQGPGSLQHRDGERWPGLSRGHHDARSSLLRGSDESEEIPINHPGRNIRSVWDIPTRNSADGHFATFPPGLPEICIKAGSREGGTVLDPFMGSGTTALVARALARKSIGIELNPDYAEICATKLQQLSLFGG